ncbi:MAG: HD domain-containing protein [Burkholderiales bacterium]
MKNDLQQIFVFIIELDKLKSVLRKTKPVGFDRYENSAEHSWQICMLAQALAPFAYKAIDINRVIEILLVHDIPEIDTGDTIVYQDKLDSSEEIAAQRIFSLLPEPQASIYFSRWKEYEVRESNEAVFAFAINRLMPVLHNLHNNGQSWKENRVSLEKIIKVNSAIGHAIPTVWELIEGQIKIFAQNGGLVDH